MPVLIDKPVGMTSHDVVAVMRRQTGEKRIGHAGTLDPLASGMLIILIGRAETKQQSTYLTMDKTYEVDVTLGATSASDDAEGPITLNSAAQPLLAKLTAETITQALTQFAGAIQQRPPTHSAIHINGERAYRLARKQKLALTDIPLRTVTITGLTLLDWTAPVARLKVDCSHGTYIRSLARDLGEVLGVGGYASALRRTRIGPYVVSDVIPYAQITTAKKTMPQLK